MKIAVFISYSDLDRVGLTVLQNLLAVNLMLKQMQVLSRQTQNLISFGQPVTITLHDPDLNLKQRFELMFIL